MRPTEVFHRRDDVQIVDVREPYEWQAGRIEGAALIPMNEVPYRLEDLDRDRPVVLVCRSGNRSGVVAAYLERAGFTAWNMEGGMEEWAEKGLPFSTPDGGPGKVG